jgi:hypothetical protein
MADVRKDRRDVEAVSTATQRIELTDTQWFCETPKDWEIWDKVRDLDCRVKRIPAKRVLFVHLK